MITGGDEFQGVLRHPSESYNLFLAVQHSIKAPFYCGVGVGEISVRGRNVLEMDGTAFHRSRDALNFAKKEKLALAFLSGDAARDLLLNLLIRLILAIRVRWTERQKQIVEYLLGEESLPLKKAAIYFKVSEQSISKIVKAANLRLIEVSEAYLRTLLGSENLVLPSAELVPQKIRRAVQPLRAEDAKSTSKG